MSWGILLAGAEFNSVAEKKDFIGFQTGANIVLPASDIKHFCVTRSVKNGGMNSIQIQVGTSTELLSLYIIRLLNPN